MGSDYYCRYLITGEVFLVHVEPKFADEIEAKYADQEEIGRNPEGKGCIFRCKDPGGDGISCAVYPSRPNICRAFRCYRMLIYHAASGELRGKIIGNAELRTQDKNLIALWEEKIALLPVPVTKKTGSVNPDDHAWIDTVIAILARHGYCGEPAE